MSQPFVTDDHRHVVLGAGRSCADCGPPADDRADEPDPDPWAAHALARYRVAQEAWLHSRAAFTDADPDDKPALPPEPKPLPPNALKHRPGWP